MDYSNLVKRLEPSATLQLTARANELKKQGRDIVSLSAGQPDFPTPAAAMEAAIKAMRGGQTGYTATPGIPELRQAVADSTSRRRGHQFKASNVVVSCGAKHSLANLLLAAVNPGDGVLIQNPYWVSYPEMVKLAGGRVMMPASGRPLITADDVRHAARDGARGLMLNSPSNPTGMVYPGAAMREIAEAALETGIWIISDDIYEDLVYLGTPAPHVLDGMPELLDRTAIVSGVSKTFAMTGWRIGWAVAPEGWVKMSNRVQEHTTSNPTSISQWAALAVVSGEADAEKASMHDAFARRRDLVCSLLSRIPGLEFAKPDGAFYVFPRVDWNGDGGSAELCRLLLEEAGLAVIPGSAFGAEGFLRLSFAASDGDIEEGSRRLGNFLSGGRSS